MNRRFNMFVADMLKPPLELVSFLFRAVYKIFFSQGDMRRAREYEDALIRDVRQELPFLFEHGGVIMPDPGPKYAFDYPIVIVSAGDVFFRFIRGRGELRVQFAPDASREWNELAWLQELFDVGKEYPLRATMSLKEVAQILRPNMDRIRDLFSVAKQQATNQELLERRQYQNVAAKELAAKINSALYPK